MFNFSMKYELIDLTKLPSRGLFYKCDSGSISMQLRKLKKVELDFIKKEVNMFLPSEEKILEYKIIVIFYKLIQKFPSIIKFENISNKDILKMDAIYIFVYILNLSFEKSDILKNYYYAIDEVITSYNDETISFILDNGYMYRPITIASFISFVNFYLVKKDDIEGNFIHFLKLGKNDLSYNEMVSLDEIYKSFNDKEKTELNKTIDYFKKIYQNKFFIENKLVDIDYNILKKKILSN
jgi:hypothetical protein